MLEDSPLDDELEEDDPLDEEDEEDEFNDLLDCDDDDELFFVSLDVPEDFFEIDEFFKPFAFPFITSCIHFCRS